MSYNRRRALIVRKAAGGLMIFKNKFLNIAVCDDDKILCSELETMLNQIADQLNIHVEISVWFSGETLQDYLNKGNRVDLVFLDIELMRLSGIDLGHYIRKELNNINIQIVYISSKTSYVIKLFKTQPYDFLIKPIKESDLIQVLKGILKVTETKNQIFNYQNGREIYSIEYDDILYFKSDRHKVLAVTKDKEIVFYGKLNDVVGKVPPQFLLIHKSYLINRDYVIRYTFEFIEMKNHDMLPISKAYQKEVRDKLCCRGEMLE